MKGMMMPTAITAMVVSASGSEGLLCIKGILRVRIMCTISVCERRPSTNQADWKSDSCAGEFACSTKYISAKVARSKTELIGPKKSMKRRISSIFHCRGLSRYSSSTRSKGIASWEKS